jgi:hypothetical protein
MFYFFKQHSVFIHVPQCKEKISKNANKHTNPLSQTFIGKSSGKLKTTTGTLTAAMSPMSNKPLETDV